MTTEDKKIFDQYIINHKRRFITIQDLVVLGIYFIGSRGNYEYLHRGKTIDAVMSNCDERIEALKTFWDDDIRDKVIKQLVKEL